MDDKALLKKEYQEKIREERKQITDYVNESKTFKRKARDNPKLSPYYSLGIIGNLLKECGLYLQMSEQSQNMLGIRNVGFLDSVRKNIHKIFAEMDLVVSLVVGERILDRKEELEKISAFTLQQKWNLIQSIHRTITFLINAYGETTKWKWSFPDLWVKMALSSKSLFDFMAFQKIRDPRHPDYELLQTYMAFIKEKLFFAATEYINKFHLSTKSMNDVSYAIRLLEELYQICNLIGDSTLASKCKSGIDSYQSLLQSEDKKTNTK